MHPRETNLSRRRWFAGLAPAAALVGTASWREAALSAESEGEGVALFHGDGRSDQTDALQRVIDHHPGGVLLTGTVRITRPIEIRLDETGFQSVSGDGTAQIVMAGSGPALRFVGTHGGTADPASVKPNVWERQRMPCIDGISIEGAHAKACGIEAIKTMGVVITRVHIRNCHHGIHFRERNRNFIISACHIYENRGIGVFYDDVDLHQSNIGDTHISYNQGGGVVSRGGNVRNIHIGNCDLEGNHPPQDAPAAEATANILIDCRPSELGTAEVAITGCTIQHTARSPDSANIRILGRSKHEREGHVTITGNVLSDVQTNVHLSGVRGATVIGNTFWMGFSHNLLMEDCAEVALASNNCNRNPRYRHSRAETATHDLLIRDCEDLTLNGFVISGVQQPLGGLRLERCRRVAMSGNVVTDCDGPHVVLDDCDTVTIGNCVIGTRQPEGRATAPAALRISKSQNVVLGENALSGRVDRSSTSS